MSTSSSSTSSLSSSSSGIEQSELALQEAAEANLEAALNVQSYRIGDRSVRRAGIIESMKVRKMLLAERFRESGSRPTVAQIDMSFS